MKATELISILQKQIEQNGDFEIKDQRDWSKFIRFWDKPKIKKFDIHTLQPFDKVLVRDGILFEWTCTLFSHIINNLPFPIYCSGGSFRYCIPYNEDTKSLVGTREDLSLIHI